MKKLETKVRGVGWHIIDWWWACIESQLTELCSCEFRKVIFISTNVTVSRTGTGKAPSTSGGRSLQFLVIVVTQHHVGQVVDLFVLIIVLFHTLMLIHLLLIISNSTIEQTSIFVGLHQVVVVFGVQTATVVARTVVIVLN